MPEYMLCSQVADKVGVKVWTVQKWIRDGKLPAYKIGREYRVYPDDLEKFIEAHRTSVLKTG